MDVDFVVLWVDGNDPIWQAEKNKYDSSVIDDSNCRNRYRDWGLMKYWFRAIEKYTPWVRKVHFVTFGHFPDFLKLDAPKLNIVMHDDFMPKEALPTFSSHALEMNIHRIPGIAEHFVYFNDDMFILRPLSVKCFFQNGLPCTYGGEIPVELIGDLGVWKHAMINDIALVNANHNKKDSVKKYGRKYVNKNYRWQDNIRTKALELLYPNYFIGFKNIHGPAAYLKSTFTALWKAEPDILKRTTMHKFRNSDSVNQWAALWWQIASGKFEPYNTDNAVLPITEETIGKICYTIREQKHDMVCLSDPDGEIDITILIERIKDAFNDILPEKSSFEN